MANFIRSAEYLEITLTGAGPTSVDLTKGQVIANCVPEHTVRIDDGDQTNRRYCEVYFTAGTPNQVTARRGTTNGVLIVGIFIVEYDSSVVTVVQGQWDITTAETGTTETISAVVLAKAFNRINYRVTESNDQWRTGTIKAKFNSTTEIAFDRIGTGQTTITGRYYIVHHSSDHFTVQHITISPASADETKTATISPAIVLADTFVINSYNTDGNTDDVDNNSVVVDIESTVLVRMRRGFNSFGDTPAAVGRTVIIEAQIIEAGANEFAVQRFECDWGDSATKTVTVTAIDLARSIIVAGGVYGGMNSQETGGAELDGNFAVQKFNLTTETVGTRGQNTTPDGTTMIEIVEFELSTVLVEAGILMAPYIPA